jgi:4-amino-4-deoxy-L-arabinose transferase-like glycosyltransferase
LFALFAATLVASHASLLRLPYFWDESGYYVPAARDLLAGSLIPFSTPSNAHPPLVMAWIALSWKIFGFSPLVTRVGMLLLAAFSLLGFFRLARTVSNTTVAGAATLLTAVYPVFFAQSSLAQVDLPAAGLIFWGLDSYFRRRWMATVVWCSLAALAKETAILVSLSLFLWSSSVYLCALCGYSFSWAPLRTRSLAKELKSEALLLIPILPLALWYAYHYTRTGYVFGNPEFFRYNVQGTLHPLRIFLAALLRIWQAVGYMNLFVLTIACAIAMRHSPKGDSSGEKQRIEIPTQMTLLAIAIVYGGALSIIGGAVLARYMLPVVPLVILVCVSTIWRRLKLWPAMIAFVALAFVQALFVNPPYGFAPEDNLAYRDYIRLHQRADAFLVTHYSNSRYPGARVLTAWPASGELTRPFLGYVEHPLPVAQIVQIEDFTAESLQSAEAAASAKSPDGRSDARPRFDVALVFSTKYQPPPNLFDRWQLWQQWKARYFGFHRDLSPEAAASALGGKLVYVEYSPARGQWIGIVESVSNSNGE